MDNKQTIKWHAQELIGLLSQGRADFSVAKMIVELEKFFVHGEHYKDIDACHPDEG